MNRFEQYIKFKVDTFPSAAHARRMSELYDPVTVDDTVDFYTDEIFSDGMADYLNSRVEAYQAVIGARTAVGWFVVELFIWLIDHDLDAHLRMQDTDGKYYHTVTESAAVLKGFLQYEKGKQETVAEEGSESPQATA